jgi:hypothetical protein
VFVVSEKAHARVAGKPQVSDATVADFSNPVYYEIISGDSLRIKRWKVSILQTIVSVENVKSEERHLTIFPNPSSGGINLQFRNIKNSPTSIVIFNSLGKIVHSEIITGTGDFTVEINLTELSSGLYFLKYSTTEIPLRVLIQKH